MKRNHQDQPHVPGPTGRFAVDITVMGGFGVAVDGVPTATRGWARRSAAALVKVLALAPGHRLHRERLMDLLWPDESLDRSTPRLHKAAHFARRAAGCDDAVVTRDDVVWLFPNAEVTVDAIRFEELARRAVGESDPDIARDALAWYRGELLPGDRYEDWAIDRRELLHLRRLDVLRVAGEWRELAELDPTNEEARVALMRRHLAAGDVGAALSEHEHLTRVLERELDIPPTDLAGSTHPEVTVRGSTSRVRALLTELADLMSRERALIAELAAVDVAPPELLSSGAMR